MSRAIDSGDVAAEGISRVAFGGVRGDTRTQGSRMRHRLNQEAVEEVEVGDIIGADTAKRSFNSSDLRMTDSRRLGRQFGLVRQARDFPNCAESREAPTFFRIRL